MTAILARDFLHLPDIEPARDYFIRQPFRVMIADKSARVAGTETTGIYMFFDPIGQRLQPQHVGDMAAALAHHACDVVLTVAEIANKRAIAFRFLERIEIGALDVFDNRKLKRFSIGCLNDNHRYLMQRGALRGAPSALAGDDLKSV